MTRDVKRIKDNIDYFTDSGEVSKLRYWIKQLRHAVGDDAAATLIIGPNANANSMMQNV